MTKEIKTKLLRNGDVTNRGENHKPVVKFFGGGACRWLITEMDSADEDTLFGLIDLGLGHTEIGYVSLSELESLKFPPFGLGVERDRYFQPKMTLNEYYKQANRTKRIIA